MRAEKQLLLDEIREKIAGAKAILLTRYTRLDANAAGDLRSAIRQTGGEFEVVSKRILQKAAEMEGLALQGLDMGGHLGIVVAAEDPIQTTKAVYQFGGDHADVVEVLGGQIDGIMYGAAEVERISKLPSLEVMRSQILGLFEAPMSQTLAVMEALLSSVMHCLENKRQKDEQA